MPDISTIVSACPLTPPQPLALRLLKLLSSTDYDRSELVDLVRQVPRVVVALLREASTASTARGMAPTLDRAVAVLGEDRVRHVVVREALSALQVDAVEGYGLHDAGFWRLSVATGRTCEVVARRCGLVPGTLYIAGLLLNVGKIALDKRIRAEDWQRGASPDEVERHVAGADHASVGAALVESWGLWEPLPTCVRFRHRPAEATQFQREVAVAHVASWAVQWLGTPMGLDAMRDTLDERAIAPLGLGEVDLWEIGDAVRQGLQAI